MEHGSLELKFIAALERLAAVMRLDLARHAREHGLSTLQAQMLLYLHASLPAEREGVRALARALGLSPGTVSESLKGLVERGYVTLSPSANHARKKVLDLTPEGKRVANALFSSVDAVRRALGELPQSQIAETYETFLEILLALFREGKIPPIRMCLSCLYYDGERSFCTFLQEPLRTEDLRIACPDHRLRE